MMQDIECGLIDKVVVYKLDRISRSLLDFTDIYANFQEHGVEFCSVQEQFDVCTPMGRAMLSITMVFAQLERSTIQQRVSDNYYERGKKKLFLSGKAPYGFEKTKESSSGVTILTPVKDTSEVLIRVFKEYGEEKKSLTAIAKALNEEGIPSPNGGLWNAGKVERILRVPVAVQADGSIYEYYLERGCTFTDDPKAFKAQCGLYIYGKLESPLPNDKNLSGKVITIAPHQGLVSSELFLRCQRRLDGNKPFGTGSDCAQKTWLKGLVKCGYCGFGAVQRPRADGVRLFYCVGKTNYHKCTQYGSLGKLTEVETEVEKRILACAEKYASMSATYGKTARQGDGRAIKELSELDESIKKLEARKKQASECTIKHLEEYIQKLGTKREALVAKRNSIDAKSKAQAAKGIGNLREEWSTLPIKSKNIIAGALIERVILRRGEIEIVWRYSF